MENWFESNPTKSIIIYTIFLIATSWTFYSFTFEESKIDNYKSQIETKQAILSQYQARIEYLENENLKYREVLKDFEEWNSKSNNPTLFYKSQYEKTILLRNESIKDNENKINFNEIKIYQYSSFIDDKMAIIVGVNNISVDHKCFLTISFSNQSNKKYKDKVVGDIINLFSNNRKIKIIINKIDYVYNYIEISIIQN